MKKLMAVVAAAVLVGACSTADPEPAESQPGVVGGKATDATGDATAGTPGTAESASDKASEAAEKLGEAARATGDAAAAAARDAKPVVEDAGITASVKTRLLADPDVAGLRIDVDTENKVVTLSGHVDSAAQITEAVRITRETSGVARVVNNLKVR